MRERKHTAESVFRFVWRKKPTNQLSNNEFKGMETSRRAMKVSARRQIVQECHNESLAKRYRNINYHVAEARRRFLVARPRAKFKKPRSRSVLSFCLSL